MCKILFTFLDLRLLLHLLDITFIFFIFYFYLTILTHVTKTLDIFPIELPFSPQCWIIQKKRRKKTTTKLTLNSEPRCGLLHLPACRSETGVTKSVNVLTVHCPDALKALEVPEFDAHVSRTRGQQLPRLVKGDVLHRVRVSFQGSFKVSCFVVPHLKAHRNQ